MLHRLCGPPSIPLSFILANVLPRWVTYHFRLATQTEVRTASDHRLRRGLPGYLIPFAPHAFVSQCQDYASKLPSPLVFLVISTHFTATLLIPLTSHNLKFASSKCSSQVEPGAFTSRLTNRLRTLYAQ